MRTFCSERLYLSLGSLLPLSPVKRGGPACYPLTDICRARSHYHDKQERLNLFRWADFPNFLSKNFGQELIPLKIILGDIGLFWCWIYKDKQNRSMSVTWNPCKVNFTLPCFLKHLIENLFEGLSDKVITCTLTPSFSSSILMVMIK